MTIYQSPLGGIAVPEVSITDLVLAGLAGRGDAPAMIDGVSGAVMTADALSHAIRQLAGGLQARGIGPGQVVALMAPNCADYAVVMHGVVYAGAALTTANPTYTAPELRHQLVDSGACMLFVHPSFLSLAREAVIGTQAAKIVVLGDGHDGAPGLHSLMGAALGAQVPVDLARDTAVLPYSSGTTGLPKGVILSHRNLVANVLQINRSLQLQPGEMSLAILPFFHIYGMQVLLNLYLATGAVLVTLPRFDLEAFLRLIQTHKMTKAFVVPPVVLALAKHPMVDQFDVSSLTFIMSAAAPLGPELSNACAVRLGCPVEQGYGMTEASPVTHLSPIGRGRSGAVGQLAPGTEGRIRDPETGADCPPGVPGEVLVRGPQVMQGYLNNPDATARTVDADGWLFTGDLGVMDDDGFLFIVDRVKELIKVKGFQVAPAELEALLVTHPDIADCAVIGLPDDEAGEVPIAFIVRRAGCDISEDVVMGHLKGHVARYKELRGVRFVDTIPKSASGKILRRVLRTQA